MPQPSRLTLFLALATGFFTVSTPAQDCSPPAITANAKTFNLFSPEQEMILGELSYQRMAGEQRFVDDPASLEYLNRLGQKLAMHLPETRLRFRFYIIDMPEANAFNTPGGYVFVSRKLIAYANSEDELAGVLAHELGHAVVHHAASQVSEELKKILNVSQLGDRKDVAEKYNLLIERRRTKRQSRSDDHESDKQREADRIGLYIMVAAGYDPQAFGSFFSRITEAKAKSGNWFTNIFDTPSPEDKRLQEMVEATSKLPAQCRDKPSENASEQFIKWQAEVLSYREGNRAEELPGLLWRKPLAPKLNSDISHFAFSPDGRYLLAQDDFAITVIQREPLQVHFQIPVLDATEASFTPDGQSVIFSTEQLRFEKWNLAEKRPVAIRELVVRRDCWEHGFSPDGKYLACVDFDASLNVLDTETGKKVWEKKDFYQLSFLELWTWIRALRDREESRHLEFFHIEFSPDSRFLAVSRSGRFSNQYHETLLALDLNSLKTVSTGGELKKVTRRSFVFLDSNRIASITPGKLGDAGIFSFPEGKRLARFELGGEELKPTSNQQYVIVKPLVNAAIGVFDVEHGILTTGLNKRDASVWKNLIVFESRSGKVQLSEFTYNAGKQGVDVKTLGTLDIPVAAINNLEVIQVSDNFQWLAMSSKTRGALWSLASGERKVFLRGFRGLILATNGSAIGDFPKLDTQNHALGLVDPEKNLAELFREIPERGARQYGGFVLFRTRLKQPKPSAQENPDTAVDDSDNDYALSREVHFELRDVQHDKPVWSRDFPQEAPRFFFDQFSGRMIFYWNLGSEVAREKLKEYPALGARAKAMGNKDDDYLIEIVDAFARQQVGTLLIETGNGSFDIKSGFSEANWLVLHDSQNRALVFSIADGELRHRFFGGHVAINPMASQVVVENNPGELTLYDLNTGNSQGRLVVKNRVAFARFSLDGKRLFVLTEDQTAYAFELEKLTAPRAVVAK